MARSAARAGRPGRFGAFGGQFVPPALLPVLDRLEAAFTEAWRDKAFRSELDVLLRDFVGRPTPLYEAARFAAPGGARLVLKRDDLLSGGTTANAALGQCLLAKRMGFARVVTDTGSGENGVATAAAAAHLGLGCTVVMAQADADRQHAAVKAIHAFGGTLEVTTADGAGLQAATGAALKRWMTDAGGTAYVAGAPIGPHPFPAIVAAFQETIGRETRRQLRARVGKPSVVVATVGGGAAALGLFSAFVRDKSVRLVAVEAAGDGDGTARLARGQRGVLHGAETLVLAGDDGAVRDAGAVAPGLAYPGAAPQLAHLAATGRLDSLSITGAAAQDTVRRFARTEGILVSLEAGHALAAAEAIARDLTPADAIAVMVASGGDKDLDLIWRDA